MNNWGGKREGAGRKKLSEDEKMLKKAITIKGKILQKINEKYPGAKLSQVIEEALIEFLKK